MSIKPAAALTYRPTASLAPLKDVQPRAQGRGLAA